ncbi:MAG: RluA family pseudouridine synthase [Halarsenatibacteraceae bacterium]
MKEEINLVSDKSNIRIDKYLAGELNYSRSYIQKLIEKSFVTVNAKIIEKDSFELGLDDKILVMVPKPETMDLEPENLNLEILYEDEYLAVINKPANLPAHPAPSYDGVTLVEGLLFQLNNLSGIGGKKRPGIVHRLDKDTSGAILIAKTDQSHKILSAQFKNRNVNKFYRAIVKGVPKHSRAKIEAPIGRDPNDRKKMAVVKNNSKIAVSIYKIISEYKGFSELEIEILTGRTHQIRAHLKFIGHPVIGDDKYGGKVNLPVTVNRQMLHAYKLEFKHPVNNEVIKITAPLFDDYIKVIDYLKNK